MMLKKTKDLFSLAHGNIVSKRNLFDLIQYSKVEQSDYWCGQEMSIGNTPQQGINWIGEQPDCRGVIIKARRQSAYKYDGWVDENENIFSYSFKARNDKINHTEKANEVLIKQPQYLYPILLFT